MQKLVSRADFARLTGKSRPGVTKLCKTKLAGACVGTRIDLAHEDAAAYLEANRVPGVELPQPPEPRPPPPPPAPKAPRKVPGRPQPLPSGDAPAPDEGGMVEALGELTLREIVDRYGTVAAYKDHLDAHVKRENALQKRLANEQTMGNLVERDRVATHIFGVINGAFERILRDVPRSLASRVHAVVVSGGSAEEIEKLIRDGNSSVLESTKAKVLRNLRRKRKKQTEEQGDE